jgi:putative ABC transport system permease protein
MNLTTTRSSLRTKEIGVKKTLGPEDQNCGQFLTESVLFSLLAMIVALLFTAIKYFSKITAGQLPTSIFSHWHYLVAFVIFRWSLDLSQAFILHSTNCF